MKKGIEFADETWNPIWGCMNLCPYCFARPIAKRFGYEIIEKEWYYRKQHNIYSNDICFSDGTNFKPTLLYSQLDKKFKKFSTHIFVNSMSDIMYWEFEWFIKILNRVMSNPDKKFIFFTKDIGVTKSHNYAEYLMHRENAVLMYTITCQYDYELLYHKQERLPLNVGICFEPMQSKIEVDTSINMWDWVIIGAETGKRKGKIEAKPEWIEPFYDLKIPVFMKESIRHLVPAEKFRQERLK